MAVSTKRFTLTSAAYQDISEGYEFCSFRMLHLGQRTNNVRIVLASALPAVDTVDYDDFRAPETRGDEMAAEFKELAASDRVFARANGPEVNLVAYRWSEGDSTVPGGIGVIATGSTVSRTLEDRFADIINAKDYIADNIGDTTDVYTELTTALANAAGRRLWLPERRYRIDLGSTGREFNIPANTIIEGDGPGTVLDVIHSGASAAVRNLFDIAFGGVTIRNLAIEITSVTHAGSTVQVFQPRGNATGLRLENVNIDGGMEEVAGAKNWIVYLLRCGASEGFDGVHADGGEWQRFDYGILKANTATTAHRDWSFHNLYIHDVFTAALQINSPSGVFDDIDISHNRFKDLLADDLSAGTSNAHFVGLIGTGGRVIGNHFSGRGKEAVHCEENAASVVISGNTSLMTDADHNFLFVLDNDVGGSVHIPERFDISGNVIKGVGKATSTAAGIWIVNDASGFAGLDQSIVRGNVIQGYETGILMSNEGAYLPVTDNLITYCGRGIWSNFGQESVRDNTIGDCDVGLFATAGGFFGYNHLIGNTAEYGSDSNTTRMMPGALRRTKDYIRLFDDFNGVAFNTTEWLRYAGTDPEAITPNITTGAIRLGCGDDPGGAIAANGSQINGQRVWRADRGGLVMEFRTLFSAITTVQVFVGLSDQNTTLEMPFTLAGDVLTSNATNAVGILFDTNATTDQWCAVGVANLVDATKQFLGVAPTTSSTTTWRIEVSVTGVATFYRNGAAIGTAMSGAVGVTTTLCPYAVINGTAARTLDIDYFEILSIRT